MAYCSSFSAWCCASMLSTMSRSTSDSLEGVPCTSLPGTGSLFPMISPGALWAGNSWVPARHRRTAATGLNRSKLVMLLIIGPILERQSYQSQTSESGNKIGGNLRFADGHRVKPRFALHVGLSYSVRTHLPDRRECLQTVFTADITVSDEAHQLVVAAGGQDVA